MVRHALILTRLPLSRLSHSHLRLSNFDRLRMSTSTVVNGFLHSLDESRARVIAEMKIDVLTATQETDNEASRKDVSRSFISDTITVPTLEMQAYAFKSSLGDDVYHDPASHALEAAVARLTGKEAALFMPSGTMSNQIGLRTHLKQPPYSILCDQRAHIHKYESGGAAFHSAAQVIPVLPANHHHLTLEDVKANVILDRDIHFAPTELIALENTLNGTIIPQAEILSIAEFAHSHGIAMHLDGARLWHVAVETGTPLSELCAPFDSVSLCFSKGLGAPVGSCLVGTSAFIQRARHFRKLFGGGMRQTGALAAAAAYAVTHHVPLLPKVHELSRTLERGLEEAGCEILSHAETCMIFFDPSPIGVDYSELDARAAALPEPIRISGSRLVVHIQTSPAAVADLISLVKTMAEEKRAEGFVHPEKKPEVNGTDSVYRDVYIRKRGKA